MALKQVAMKLVGVRPLLMHSSRLVDPFDEYTLEIKKITNLPTKERGTEENIRELRRLEWFGGLYTDESGAVALPEGMILAAMIGGAKKQKLGPKAKAGVLCPETHFRLDYDGPKELDELYEDGRFCDVRAVGVNGSGKVMRSRPIFNQWSANVEFVVDTSVIDAKQVRQAMEMAGTVLGIGDYRPRFGRFEVAN